MLAEQFLEISVCKPCETHRTYVSQSVPSSSVAWVAQSMPEVFLNKGEAA